MDIDIETFDAAMLKVINRHDDKHGLRASDIHFEMEKAADSGFIDLYLCPVDRDQVEAAIDRLLEIGAIRDVTTAMDFHSHYKPVNVLDRLARISSRKSGRACSAASAGRDLRSYASGTSPGDRICTRLTSPRGDYEQRRSDDR